MRTSDNEQGINKGYIHLRIHLRLSVILNTSNKRVFKMFLPTYVLIKTAYYKSKNTGTRNNGTRNTSGIAGTTQRKTRITAEYRNNGTSQKLEPEDRHGIFH